jgi:hypothetical protein
MCVCVFARAGACVRASERASAHVCVCVCVIIILNTYTDPDDLSTLVLVEWQHCSQDHQGSQQVYDALLGFSQ